MNLLSYWSNITETRHLKSCGCVFEDRLACGLYRLMVWCLEMNMGVFLLQRSKDASRHCVTEQLYVTYNTGSTELVPLFLNLIRDRDGRFSERLSCEASRSSLTIDSVWDVSVRIQRLFVVVDRRWTLCWCRSSRLQSSFFLQAVTLKIVLISSNKKVLFSSVYDSFCL